MKRLVVVMLVLVSLLLVGCNQDYEVYTVKEVTDEGYVMVNDKESIVIPFDKLEGYRGGLIFVRDKNGELDVRFID